MNDFVLWQGDYLEWLKGLEGESVDLVVAVPPYGIGYRSYWMTRSSGVPRTTRRDFGKDVMQVAWMDEVFRVLKNDSLVYQPGVLLLYTLGCDAELAGCVFEGGVSGRRFWGCEIDQNFFEIAERRLNGHGLRDDFGTGTAAADGFGGGGLG